MPKEHSLEKRFARVPNFLATRRQLVLKSPRCRGDFFVFLYGMAKIHPTKVTADYQSKF